MTQLHSDRKILRCIYDMYVADYPGKGDPHVPVDLTAVAERLGMLPHLLFGRLHYDMGTRFRHRDPTNPGNTLASIFEVKVGGTRHAVNFPYLAAVLAQLEETYRRDAWTIGLSIAAIIVAVGSALVQLATR